MNKFCRDQLFVRRLNNIVTKTIFRTCYKVIERKPMAVALARRHKRETQNGAPNGDGKSLADHLYSRINATGPIPVASYMKEVLLNPSGGYYSTKDVLGTKSDFVTAPETGQIFGELIAIWCISELSKFGHLGEIQLIELGPGRGTFMSDILRVFDKLNATSQISVHLVEMSPHLSTVQASTLCKKFETNDTLPHYMKGETHNGAPVYWYKDIAEVPAKFSVILANEFFDALPVNVFKKDEDIWKEILVDINHTGGFRFVLSKAATPLSMMFGKQFGAVPELINNRTQLEMSFETEYVARNIANRLHENGGIGLIIDYGHMGDKSDTLRSFKDHKLHDPLVNPGDADITADVDFRFLKYFLEHQDKAITVGPVEQSSFLNAMEGKARLEVLLRDVSDEKQKQFLQKSYDELTSPAKMGHRFKLVSVFPATLKDFLQKHNVMGF